MALYGDPPAPYGNQRIHGPHERLSRDSPTAKRIKSSADKGENFQSRTFSPVERRQGWYKDLRPVQDKGSADQGESLKYGKWSADEDEHLMKEVEEHGGKNCTGLDWTGRSTVNLDWTAIASHLSSRSSKQCRDRWLNHLQPQMSKSGWTPEEDQQILDRVQELGTKWTQIANLY